MEAADGAEAAVMEVAAEAVMRAAAEDTDENE
jgi:hypothetical protein